MRIRKLVVSLLVAICVILGFTSKEAQAKISRQARHVPRWATVSVQSGDEGDLARDVQITVSRMNRRGKTARRPSEKVAVTLAGGGIFRWEQARFGQLYAVKVVEVSTAEILLHESYLAIRGFAERTLRFPGITAPVDPRVTLLAQLREDIAALESQLGTVQAQNLLLATQLSAVQAQLASEGTQNVALIQQLAALQVQQNELLAQNAALNQQITNLLAQIVALQAQLDAGTPVETPVVTRNSAFANPTISVGATQARVASFLVTAPTAQGVQIFSLTFDRDLGTGLNLQNLTAKIGSTQFGTTKNVVNA